MLPNLGIGELTVILVIILVLFGAKRLPEIARSFGQSANAFKKGLKEGEAEGEDEDGPKQDPPAS